MKNIPVALLGLLLLAPIISYAANADSSVFFRAMQDELNRSVTRLQIENQERPYYISYRAVDHCGLEATASFGGLLHSTRDRYRDVFVDLRVGSRDFDNSNFACQMRGPSGIESDHTNLPIEDDYYALRQSLWLVTDGTYKKALAKFARKKAYVQNKQSPDTIPDFAAAAACSVVEQRSELSIDETAMRSGATRLSRIFQKYPGVIESSVTLGAHAGNQYFVDNEGALNQHGKTLAYVEVQAKAQSREGEQIDDFIGFYAPEMSGLDMTGIERAITARADTLTLQSAAKKAESYSGPVLFLGQASAELFFQILGKGVSDPRAPEYESEMLEQGSSRKNIGMLAGRLGRKVTSHFISAYDDPNLKTWKGTPLIGDFSVDDQGVKAQRAELIKDGKLVGLLMSRSPVEKIRVSNGHGKYHDEDFGSRIIGMVSNLIIESSNTKGPADLIDMLINSAKEYGNSYAVIISRLQPTKPRSDRERYMSWYAPQASDKPLLSPPLIACRIDVETRKTELLRGIDFSGVTTRILRDITAAGDESYVYNFLYRDDQDNSYPISVVAPAVLVEEVDLAPKEGETTRPPVMKHPYFGKEW
jgi:predicted Zn-dependent protease